MSRELQLPEHARESLLGILAGAPEVRRALVFGSRARGDASERSDIDLAVDAPAMSSRAWLDLLAALEEPDTLLRVDVSWLQEADEELRAKVAAEGLVLYERG